MRKVITYLIRVYRYCISPFLPPSCRFVPTCSEYTLEAVQSHGVIKGLFLGSCRICRCHPFAKGGFDPVPNLECTANHLHTAPLVSEPSERNNNNG